MADKINDDFKKKHTSYTDDKYNIIIKCIEEGMAENSSIRVAGVPQATWSDWKADSTELVEAVNIAKGRAELRYTNLLRKSAEKGCVEAIKFWMTNRARDKWKDSKHIDQNISGDNPFKIVVEVKDKPTEK